MSCIHICIHIYMTHSCGTCFIRIYIYVYIYTCTAIMSCIHIYTYIYTCVWDIYINIYICVWDTSHLSHAWLIRDVTHMWHHSSSMRAARISHRLDWYGVATIGRLLTIIGLFCKRALQKRPIFCKRDHVGSADNMSSLRVCIHTHPHTHTHSLSCALSLLDVDIDIDLHMDMWWLRLVGSLKL